MGRRTGRVICQNEMVHDEMGCHLSKHFSQYLDFFKLINTLIKIIKKKDINTR